MASDTIGRIDSITLDDMLPQVFAGEKMERSDVWRTKLTLHRGCRVIIEAASGTGKSSLCAYIYGTRDDYQGSLRFNSKDSRSLSVDAWQHLRRESLAYLPQDLGLFPELTAMENIELKRGLTNAVERSKVEEWMRELGIDFRADYLVGKLSIGQQQRVALIRALCQPFDFILLDEPVSHLDEANNEIAARIVCQRAEEMGAGIIATSVGNRLAIADAETICL